MEASQFNPALGTLESVNLTIAGNIDAAFAAENLGSIAAGIDWSDNGTIVLTLPGGGATISATPSIASGTSPLAAFDGTLDFAGSSGTNQSGLTQAASNQLTVYSDLAAFTGSGTVALPVSALASSFVSGPGDLAYEMLTQAGAEVEVSYTYLPASSVLSPASGPSITGTAAGQTAIGDTPVDPFANVVIADPAINQTQTVTVTLSNPANGTLSDWDAGGYNPATGVYTLVGSASAVTLALRRLTFTASPWALASGQTVITGLTVQDSDTASASVTDTTTTVSAAPGVSIDAAAVAAEIGAAGTPKPAGPVIAGTTAGQTQTAGLVIAPFSGVTITDAGSGQIQTVTVTLSNPANGTLLTGGTGVYNAITGVYTDSGSAASVTAALHRLLFDAPATQASAITTAFSIQDTDSAGISATNDTTTVISSDHLGLPRISLLPSTTSAPAGVSVNPLPVLPRAASGHLFSEFRPVAVTYPAMPPNQTFAGMTAFGNIIAPTSIVPHGTTG